MNLDVPQFYLYLVVAGFLATFSWRFMGVLFAEQLNEDSEILVWVRLVASSLMAALVARIVLFPPGTLDDTMVSSRILGVAAGILVYFLIKRSLFLSVAAAAAMFLAAEYMQIQSIWAALFS